MNRFLSPRARVVRFAWRFALAALVLAPAVASAQGRISGGVDPEGGITGIGNWLMGTLLGLFWVVVVAVRGMHLGVSGRQALPYIGYAVAGIVVSFGATYWLTTLGYGV